MKKFFLFVFLSSLLFANIQDDNLTYGKLENGLSYFIKANSYPKDMAYFYLVINAGSIDEKDNQLGIAHLLEHLAFSGTKDFKQDDIIKTLESLGVNFGSHLNASTSFEDTIYKLQIKANDENIAQALKVLQNMASKITFEQSAIDREKKVVSEEDRISNSSSMRIFKQELPYIFKDSIYAKRLPIGDMKIIKNASKQDIIDYYDDNYFAQNMSLIAVGDFDEQEVLKVVKQYFSQIKSKQDYKKVDKNIAFFDESIYFNSFDEELINDKVRIYFQSPAYKIDNVENFKKDIINDFVIKLFALYNEKLISNKLILNPIYFSSSNLYNQKILNIFEKSVTKKDYKDSLSKIFSAINYLLQNGFDLEEFNAVKKEMISQNENFFKTIETRKSDYFVSYYIDYLRNGSLLLSDEKIYKLNKEILQDINLQDVNEAFKQMLQNDNIIVEVLSQKAYNLSLKDIEKLKNSKAFKIPKVTLIKDEINSLSLKPVNFISSSFDEESGIYSYEFKNGVEVFFKALNDDKDSLDFRFLALGGNSNINNIKLAQIAINSSNKSGVGELNQYEYEKFKKGKLFYFFKYINETSRGYEAKSQLSFFEDMLKAFYIDFTNPKIDPLAFERNSKISIDLLDKNENNPEYIFAKEQNEIYYNSNSKLAFFEKEDFYLANTRQLYDFIKNKYSNAGEFYLIVSGDIKREDFEALIKKYIGNLPGNKTGEIIKDDKIRPINKDEVFERFYGKENISKVKIILNNQKVKYSVANKEALQATSSILSNILREKIRAKQGRVYGISLNSNLSKIPYLHSQVVINFSSDPQNRYEIIEDVKKQIANLDEIDQSYLDNYKKMMKIELEKLYKKNSFWKLQIDNYILTGEKIKTLNERKKDIDNLSLEDIKNCIKLYFLDENVKEFISIYSPKELENQKK